MKDNDTLLRTMAYKEIELNKNTVEKDIYRQKYHIMPPVGLLNDPNGFIHFKEKYHLFFQWMPFKTEHGAKFWGHYTSDDLVNWQLEPIALAPSEPYEKDGCYSGSAIEVNNTMVLFYTGNVKNTNNERETYQCMATSKDGINFLKNGVVVNLPLEGFTAHFRDPKVFKHNGTWYMVIGAQTSSKQGNVAIYESNNLENWILKGNLIDDVSLINKLGYMWECPDLFSLDSFDVLLFSPQGVKPEGIKYNNIYQTGYVVGKMDYTKGKLTHGDFFELDRGFDFYAPQTTLDYKGRRLMFGWMGVPEQDEKFHPTHKYKWIHNMTLPRELRLKNGKLYQTPVQELKKMRKNEKTKEFNLSLNKEEVLNLESKTTEVFIDISHDNLINDFCISFFSGYCLLIYDQKLQILTLKRKGLTHENLEARSCYLESLENLHIFLDNSSLEIFINYGAEVFSSRIFPENNDITLKFTCNTAATLNLNIWSL